MDDFEGKKHVALWKWIGRKYKKLMRTDGLLSKCVFLFVQIEVQKLRHDKWKAKEEKVIYVKDD